LAVLSAITRNEGAEPILTTAPKGCHSRGIIYTITDGSIRHGYTVVAFHPESKGVIIYLFPKDGSGKGSVLNINHDIVPQAIGKTLIGVSQDKEISKGNATHHTTTLQEEGIKERNNKRKD